MANYLFESSPWADITSTIPWQVRRELWDRWRMPDGGTTEISTPGEWADIPPRQYRMAKPGMSQEVSFPGAGRVDQAVAGSPAGDSPEEQLAAAIASMQQQWAPPQEEAPPQGSPNMAGLMELMQRQAPRQQPGFPPPERNNGGLLDRIATAIGHKFEQTEPGREQRGPQSLMGEALQGFQQAHAEHPYLTEMMLGGNPIARKGGELLGHGIGAVGNLAGRLLSGGLQGAAERGMTDSNWPILNAMKEAWLYDRPAGGAEMFRQLGFDPDLAEQAGTAYEGSLLLTPELMRYPLGRSALAGLGGALVGGGEAGALPGVMMAMKKIPKRGKPSSKGGKITEIEDAVPGRGGGPIPPGPKGGSVREPKLPTPAQVEGMTPSQWEVAEFARQVEDVVQRGKRDHSLYELIKAGSDAGKVAPQLEGLILSRLSPSMPSSKTGRRIIQQHAGKWAAELQAADAAKLQSDIAAENTLLSDFSALGWPHTPSVFSEIESAVAELHNNPRWQRAIKEEKATRDEAIRLKQGELTEDFYEAGVTPTNVLDRLMREVHRTLGSDMHKPLPESTPLSKRDFGSRKDAASYAVELLDLLQQDLRPGDKARTSRAFELLTKIRTARARAGSDMPGVRNSLEEMGRGDPDRVLHKMAGLSEAEIRELQRRRGIEARDLMPELENDPFIKSVLEGTYVEPPSATPKATPQQDRRYRLDMSPRALVRARNETRLVNEREAARLKEELLAARSGRPGEVVVPETPGTNFVSITSSRKPSNRLVTARDVAEGLTDPAVVGEPVARATQWGKNHMSRLAALAGESQWALPPFRAHDLTKKAIVALGLPIAGLLSGRQAYDTVVGRDPKQRSADYDLPGVGGLLEWWDTKNKNLADIAREPSNDSKIWGRDINGQTYLLDTPEAKEYKQRIADQKLWRLSAALQADLRDMDSEEGSPGYDRMRAQADRRYVDPVRANSIAGQAFDTMVGGGHWDWSRYPNNPTVIEAKRRTARLLREHQDRLEMARELARKERERSNSTRAFKQLDRVHEEEVARRRALTKLRADDQSAIGRTKAAMATALQAYRALRDSMGEQERMPRQLENWRGVIGQ